MIARLRVAAFREMGQKVRAILLKRKKKKYAIFTQLYQCIKKPSACIVCIRSRLLCNIMGVNSRAENTAWNWPLLLEGHRMVVDSVLSCHHLSFWNMVASLLQDPRPKKT